MTAGTTGRPTARPLRHPEGTAPRVRRARAVTLLLLTLLVPGSAQLVAGNRGLGRLALRVWLTVLLAAVLVALVAWFDRGLVLTLATRTSVLLGSLISLVLLGLGWAVLFVNAWRLGSPRTLDPVARRGVAVLTACCLVVSSAPLLYGAYLVSVQRDFIGDVFADGPALEPVDGRYNVLLMGGDAGADRVGLRPDSLQLASIDADTGATVLFGLPRNMQNVPFPEGSPLHEEFPDGYDCGDECLLNAIYTYATERPELYPGADDPGAEATKDAVEGVTGLTVPAYILIDLQDFSDLIDALGGVDLDVERRIPIGGGSAPVEGYIEPGQQKLDGFTALWYARSREGSSDYDRMTRQAALMSAMLGQLDPATVLTRFQQVASASKAVITTDIPGADLGSFVDLAVQAKGQPVQRLAFTPPDYTPARPDFDQIRTDVQAAVAEPPS